MPVKPTPKTILSRLEKADPKVLAGDVSGKAELKEGDASFIDAYGRLSALEKAAVLRVVDLKDVNGKADEQAGKGDARVSSRRNVLATLLADRLPYSLAFDNLGPQVQADIKWLLGIEFRDIKEDSPNPFGAMRYSDAANTEFTKRVSAATTACAAFEADKASFVDVGNGSVLALRMIKDPGKRADALTDAVLQFRGRTDAAIDRKTWSATDYMNQTRIDALGPVAVAEQRMMLAGLDLSANNGAAGLEYALAREVIASHPNSSVNGVFEARNAVGVMFMDGGDNWSSTDHATAWVRYEVPPGASASPYSSIHHNFSRDTPKNIEAMLEHWLLPGETLQTKQGPISNATVFLHLADALKAAQSGQVKDITTALDFRSGVEKPMARLKPFRALRTAVADAVDRKSKPAEVVALLRDFLVKNATKDLGKDPVGSLLAAATVYRSVCTSQFTELQLQDEILRSGPASIDLAQLLIHLERNEDVSALREIGEARTRLKDGVVAEPLGWKRHQYLLIDAKLQRMQTEMLGSAVQNSADLSTPEQRGLALTAVHSALRGAIAGGLQQLKLKGDAAAGKPEALTAFVADLGKLIDHAALKGVSLAMTGDEYRAVMGQGLVLVKQTIQDMRALFDARAGALAMAKVPLDPGFLDQLIKQSPLHYATALLEKGLRVGLQEKITPRSVENVSTMRVLNGIGPVVFSSAVFAENGKELAKMGVTKDQLAILFQLEEKKMVAVGGLFVDTAQAPGGNSHLNMYAMNNGIPVVALPELRTRYAEFFATAEKEGGIYIDDTDGNFRMLTVAKAVEDGLIAGAKVGDAASIADGIAKLRPGMNRNISFLKPTADGLSHELLSKHDAIISPQRGTRVVELYIPQETVRGIGKGCPTFDELATLGIHARHLAGEKGTVLALLRSDPALRPFVPDGSQMTPGDIRDMLKAAPLPSDPTRTLADLWDTPWNNDPKVGIVDDKNFLSSDFYTDRGYRDAMRQRLQDQTRIGLTSHFLGGDGKTLSAAGEALYAQMMRNPSLADNKNGSCIYRSSFTGEDRPGKSGAGQYESYVDRKMANKLHGKDVVDGWFAEWQKAKDASPKDAPSDAFITANKLHNERLGPARVASAIGVIESTWMPEPVENNVAEQFYLPYIGPTVAMQACVSPDISGVTISRDLQSGARNAVTFQIVKGFGGGVDGGKATEGVIDGNGTRLSMVDGSVADGGAVKVQGIDVSEDDMKTLRDVVLKVEQFFHKTVEPNKGYAVDMEVARQDGVWQIVQARVILVDK
jgi:hypothetical protein